MRRTALVVLAAALVAGVALTAARSLSGGFDRAAARADLPDLIVRFDPEQRAEVARRIEALPNVAATTYRLEGNDVPMATDGGRSRRGAVHLVERGRRGYALLEGRHPRRFAEAVVERGVAEAWDLEVGDEVRLGRGPELEVVGISLSPDNVAFPLAAAPRIYVDLEAWEDFPGDIPVRDIALAWLTDPARQDVTLTQARSVSYGLTDLQFVTRAGVQVLVGQAAGIVIALLVAFSVVAVGAAVVMLGASARSEVARRLPAIGVERALGFTRGTIVREQARRGAVVAAPAAALGLLLGWLAVRGPSERLLVALNQVGPGAGIVPWLAGAWLAIVALVAAASAWPAWRATAGPVAPLLRGGDLAVGGAAARRAPAGGGFAALGARLGATRPGRWAATTAVLGVATGTVVLLLAIASLLLALQDDPSTLGKRYELTARQQAASLADVRGVDGVEAVARRTQVEASAAFALGQPLRLVGFPRGAEDFEAPPLAEGRRRRAAGEAEVGVGLAETLGLRPGSTLAVALPTGAERRYRVVGLVRALENEGRVAYVRSGPLEGSGDETLAVALAGGADADAVSRGLLAVGAQPSAAAAATTDDRGFLAILATLLRVVALTVALVCLVVLAQALVITARERRATLALLRTVGAGRGALTAVLAGACAVVLVPAALLGLALEAVVLGPAVASLAAGYAGLSLAPTAGHVALAAGGLAVLGAAAVWWVTRRVTSEPVVAGLREEAV